MNYQDLEYLLSQPRLNRYLAVCHNSKTDAKKLYKANLRLAQSFYPILNLFEVIFRNVIHYQLSSHFSNPNWIITERTGFMNDTSLAPSRYYLRNQIVKAERKIRRRGTLTSGKVIAEQSFGFWTSLFEPHHYRLVGGSVIRCFPNKPAVINRSSILVKLTRIREFRNRIYHNEPICFVGSRIDFSIAENIKIDIYDLLEWISDEAKDYIEVYDNIDNKILIGKRYSTEQ